jgi:mycofactocin system glycosyltransferase
MTSSRRATRYRLDNSVQRFGTTVIGGSPLKLFRVTEAGSRLVDRLVAGEAVRESTLVTALLEAGAIHPEPGPDLAELGPDDITIVTPLHRAAGSALPTGVAARAIVVDDGSPMPIEGATIRLEHNQGPAAARNAGLALVTTPLVAFVDGDVELGDGWLEHLLPHFGDTRVGLVAPRVHSVAGVSSLAGYERDNSPLDLGPQPARVRAGSRVGYVPAAAIVCRTDAVRGIGGFDASLRFGEDVDLVWRLDAAGWRCRYEPAAEVGHAPRPSWQAWVRQRVDYGSSAAPLARRHAGALAPLRMSGWSLGAWALVATGHPLLGSGVGAGSAAALVPKLPDVPPPVAFRLAALGNLRAGDQIANAVRRVWWPLLLIAALRSKSARRVLLASALAARHPLRLADDVAYSVGVWKGVVSERTLDPLLPELTAWPGKQVGS